MTEEEIIDYVMNTPGNSNPAVLGGMLSQYGGSGSGEVFWVTYTVDAIASDESDETVFICDHTYQEIREAINNNKIVIAKHNNGIYYLANAGLFSVSFCLSRIEMSEEGIPYELYWALFTHEETGNIICGNYTENITPQTNDTLTLYIDYNNYTNGNQGLIYLNPDLTQKARSNTIIDALNQEKTIKLYGIQTSNNRTIKYNVGYCSIDSYFINTITSINDDPTYVRFVTEDYE